MKKILFVFSVCCFCALTQSSFADECISSENTSTVCFQYPTTGNINRICEGKSSGENCSIIGATSARCIENSDSNGTGLSCAPWGCDNSHLLWMKKNGSNTQSWGRCVSKSWLQNQCAQNCMYCNMDTEECLINELDVASTINNSKYSGKGFLDKEACTCQAKPGVPQETPEEKCYLFLSGSFSCRNGKTVQYEANKIPVPKRFLQGENCTEFQRNGTKIQTFINELKAKVCGEQVSSIVGNGGTPVNDAESRLLAFFNSVEGSVNVWKDSEGKFNTARLASDLTAGVVLGTVGGVVSGVVIKKKQVEKGFDVLHCTVGGQTVADWGDEFIVGLK